MFDNILRFITVLLISAITPVSNLQGINQEGARVSRPTPINGIVVIPTATSNPTSTTSPKPTVAKVNTQEPAQPTANKIECIGPDGVHFWTTQKECDMFNRAWGKQPDYADNTMVNCTYEHLASRFLRLDECKRSGECQVGPGNWVWYANANDCRNLQNAARGPVQNIYSPPLQPILDCVLSTGTYKVSQGTCDNMKRSDEDFRRTINDFNNNANRDLNAEYEKSRQQEGSKTTTIDSSAYNNCMNQARSAYQGEEQRAIATGLGNSAGAFMLSTAKSNFDKAVANCNLYPH